MYFMVRRYHQQSVMRKKVRLASGGQTTVPHAAVGVNISCVDNDLRDGQIHIVVVTDPNCDTAVASESSMYLEESVVQYT
jgi:hypothetical protein